MTKLEFFKTISKYIGDTFYFIEIETENYSIAYDFEEDNLFLGDDYFIITVDCSPIKMKYAEVKSISI